MEPVVGIFSRDGVSEYSWLLKSLNSEYYEVLPFCISNDNHHKFIQQIKKCQFAILYHTRNRGRINITDVTDSLYDVEIQTLSQILGKDRVIVVIDDLEDSSEEARNTILNGQPTLLIMTAGIFLFTQREKSNEQILRNKLQPIIFLIQMYERRPWKTVYYCMIATFSAIAIHETYHSPVGRNFLLVSLWAAVLTKTIFWKPFSFLSFISRIHSVLPWTVSLVSLYNAYRRPNIYNVALCAFWCIASSGRAHYRYPSRWRSFLKTMRYSLVIYSFYIGYQIPDTTGVSDLLSVRTVLCSPAIMAAV
ncbi:uncharacterized protein [Pyxicephalus adspersus]|uniref:uncharacterized protein isoform X2 n=1 Tax=Pyxicephalus adspersus TaxID=30357 RepID=UPI003B591790